MSNPEKNESQCWTDLLTTLQWIIPVITSHLNYSRLELRDKTSTNALVQIAKN